MKFLFPLVRYQFVATGLGCLVGHTGIRTATYSDTYFILITKKNHEDSL